MCKTLIFDFGNIIKILTEQNLKLCFIKDKGMLVLDSNGYLFEKELFWQGSYLDGLIKNNVKVTFNRLNLSISKKLQKQTWAVEIWNVTDVERFLNYLD